MVKNKETISEEMWPLYHEAGHWMIANALGYGGYLTGDLEKGQNFSFVQTSPKVISLQGLKNQILISFGGLSAEKLLEIPLNFGHIGDLTIACDFLKTLNNLEGKTFNYENYLDFPDKEYDYYLSQGEIVLNKVGGKETILKVGNYFYEELNKMKKIK